MAKGKAKSKEVVDKPRKSRPALSPEARENYMIGLAMDLAEQRLLDGTATAQEVCHFLKLGSTRERDEREIIHLNKGLIEAKTESYQTAKHIEELYTEAINSLRRYSGHYSDVDETYEEDLG